MGSMVRVICLLLLLSLSLVVGVGPLGGKPPRIIALALSRPSLLTAYKTVIIIIIPSLVFLVSAQLSFLLLRNFQLEPCSPQMSQRLLVLDLLQSCVVLLPFIPVQNLSQYTTRPPNVLVRLPILVPLQATRPTAIQLP